MEQGCQKSVGCQKLVAKIRKFKIPFWSTQLNRKWSGIVKFGSVSVSDVKFVREIKLSSKITILMSEIAFLEDRY